MSVSQYGGLNNIVHEQTSGSLCVNENGAQLDVVHRLEYIEKKISDYFQSMRMMTLLDMMRESSFSRKSV